MKRSHVRTLLAAVPLVICNLIAFTGQLSFIRDHLHWPLVGDIGFAAGLESMAVFLAFMAHDALMAEDSAFKLRMGAYGIALVAAGLNWSHYSVHMHPTFAAVGTAVMSGASPFLWGTLSKRASRDQLMAKGLIEPRALQLGSTRWVWHPIKSFRVMRAATWSGVRDPAEAIAATEARADALVDTGPDLDSVRDKAVLDYCASDASRVRYAIKQGIPPEIGPLRGWLADHDYDVAEVNLMSILRREAAKSSGPFPAVNGSNGNGHHLDLQELTV